MTLAPFPTALTPTSSFTQACQDRNKREVNLDMDEENQKDWLRIPADIILEEILPRLSSFVDRQAFRAVCSSWNSITKQRSDLFRVSQIPLVMVPAGPDSNRIGERHQLMYNIVDKKTHKVNIPEMKPVFRVVSSSPDGWLLYMDEAFELHALNLITRKSFILPSIATFPRIVSVKRDDQGHITAYKQLVMTYGWANLIEIGDVISSYYINRAIIIPPSMPFNGRDVSDRRHIVVVLQSLSHTGLTYAWEGDQSWTEVTHICSIANVVVHKGLLYGVRWSGVTFAIDISPPGKRIATYKKIRKGGVVETVSQDGDEPYLVEIDGNLWRIFRKTEVIGFDEREEEDKEIQPGDEGTTTCVKLSKLNTKKKMWVEMSSIGDHVVFLGANNPVVVSTKDFPMFEPNCIYFMDHSFEIYPYQSPVDNMGVFNLKDNSFKPYCISSVRSHFWPPPCWVWTL